MKNKKRLILTVLLLTILAMLFASPSYAKKAKKPALNKKKVTIKLGKTTKLKVKRASGPVIWTSSNESVAVVSNDGRVTGIASGKANVYASVAGKVLRCKVTVKGKKGKKSTPTPDPTPAPAPTVTITSPTLPKSASNIGNNKIYSTYTVEDFKTEVSPAGNKFIVKLIITVTKTFGTTDLGIEGTVPWKLYDTNNIIITSGSFAPGSMTLMNVGDRFLMTSTILSIDAGTYRLEF